MHRKVFALAATMVMVVAALPAVAQAQTKRYMMREAIVGMPKVAAAPTGPVPVTCAAMQSGKTIGYNSVNPNYSLGTTNSTANAQKLCETAPSKGFETGGCVANYRSGFGDYVVAALAKATIISSPPFDTNGSNGVITYYASACTPK